VVVGDLQVVLRRDGLRVADPLANDVHGEVFGEFRLPRATKVLKQFGPGLKAATALSRSQAGHPGGCSPRDRDGRSFSGRDRLSSHARNLSPHRLSGVDDLQVACWTGAVGSIDSATGPKVGE